MNADIRIRLDMASRIQGFCRAHPSDDPGYIGLVIRLDDRVTRATALAEQERSGHLTAHASVVSKDDLKASVRDNLLVLGGIAELVAVDQPGLDARLEVPSLDISHRAFLTAARVALSQATPLRDLFLGHGMPATFLEDLTKLVDHYEQAVNEKLAARSAHVGAHADLEAVTAEIMLVAQLLDRINRVRFRKDPELLAAWKSARDVAWPIATKEEPPPSDSGAEPAA